MKKSQISFPSLTVLFLFLISFFTQFLYPNPIYAAGASSNLAKDQLHARSAVLMDADSGRVLFGKNEEDILPMASTTKIMTCILALECADPSGLVEVSAYAAKMPDVQLNMVQGEYYLLEDLLYSLMLESHNDSAVAIAEHVGGSVEEFAASMNKKAAEIGCTNTFFVTPNGLDASRDVTLEDGSNVTKVHATTAKDLASILRYCIILSPQKDRFLEITRTASHSFHNKLPAKDGSVSDGARSFSCYNHNAFLNMMEGALTGKTGFTGNAGYCYTGALKRDGKTYIIALLACGWPGNKTWKWQDARKLFEYGLANYEKQDLAKLLKAPQPVPVENAAGTGYLLDQALLLQPVLQKESLPVLLSDQDQVEVRVNIPDSLEAPVASGSRLGTVEVYVNEALLAEIPATASHEIKARSRGWYIRLVFLRFFHPYPALIT